jgi:hypothetical protein
MQPGRLQHFNNREKSEFNRESKAAAKEIDNKKIFTTETPSAQSSEYFWIKNYILRVLRASAVSALLDRCGENEHRQICASRDSL